MVTIIEKLSEENVHEILKDLNLKWELSSDKKVLSHKFTFKGFYKTMGFVNAVAWIAQQEMHHPDLEVSYCSCLVKYTTHDSGGLTKNDIHCIKRIEALNP